MFALEPNLRIKWPSLSTRTFPLWLHTTRSASTITRPNKVGRRRANIPIFDLQNIASNGIACQGPHESVLCLEELFWVWRTISLQRSVSFEGNTDTHKKNHFIYVLVGNNHIMYKLRLPGSIHVYTHPSLSNEWIWSCEQSLLNLNCPK